MVGQRKVWLRVNCRGEGKGEREEGMLFPVSAAARRRVSPSPFLPFFLFPAFLGPDLDEID
jgi:hypothetical protein